MTVRLTVYPHCLILQELLQSTVVSGNDVPGTAKRCEVPDDVGFEQNKRSCFAREGDGRSAASPTGRLPNASSGPAYQISVANPHFQVGVDASAQDLFDSARRAAVKVQYPELSQDCNLGPWSKDKTLTII